MSLDDIKDIGDTGAIGTLFNSASTCHPTLQLGLEETSDLVKMTIGWPPGISEKGVTIRGMLLHRKK